MRLTGTKRALAVGAITLALAPLCHGYYYFVQYLQRSSPFSPIFTKFDLNALPNKTVSFLVAEQGPAVLASGDSFAAVLSQIRLAAKQWNDVTSSDLRLTFGGLFTPGAPQASPDIEIVFDDIPPGLVAYGGPTLKADAAPGDNGTFVPIIKSTIVFNRDMSTRPSWSEAFFLTATHEIGHALGLQHTLTSSVMSTEITRATTKAKPLAIDDITGISLLYPTQGWLANQGSLQGRVTLGANPVTLASVVAISLDGAAISALTNPDGTYRIDGIPPGSYYVYVHPLPPAVTGENFPAGLTPPTDADGRAINATSGFETQFFPGVKDLVRAVPVALAPGQLLDSINFSVTRRSSPALYGVTTYSFPAQVAVKPAYLSVDTTRPFLVAAGYGLTPSAGVQVLGGSVTIPPGGVKPYSQDSRYVQVDFQLSLLSGEGYRHLMFTFDNDLYILPSAFRLTRRPPPQISSIASSLDAAGNKVVVLSGTGLSSDTTVLFDGQPAVVRSADDGAGVITVVPPPGTPGQRSPVVALNKDGQSSLFVQAAALPTYDYDAGDVGSLSISPSQVPPGVDTMVEITGLTAPFVQNYVNLALGNSGIVVRRVWDGGPGRILANISVAPNAPTGNSTVSVFNGLRMTTLSGGFSIGSPVSVAAIARSSTFQGAVTDAITGRPDVAPGAVAQVRLTGPIADQAGASLQITVGERPSTVLSFNSGLLTFRVPAGLAPGAAILRVTAGTDTPRPIVMGIDIAPPTILSVTSSGVRLDATRPARPGEILTVLLTNVTDNGQPLTTSRVSATVGGNAQQVVQINSAPNGYQAQFVLDPATAAGSQPLTIGVDGRLSDPFTLPVRAN